MTYERYTSLQVAALARWLVAHVDVLDYIVASPHDESGAPACAPFTLTKEQANGRIRAV